MYFEIVCIKVKTQNKQNHSDCSYKLPNKGLKCYPHPQSKGSERWQWFALFIIIGSIREQKFVNKTAYRTQKDEKTIDKPWMVALYLQRKETELDYSITNVFSRVSF